MLNIPQSCRVALLIDADNLQPVYTKQILCLADYYGKLTICRAYGDWKKSPLSSWYHKIRTLNIKTIQVERVGKDSSDKQLMIEAGEILGADEADVFIIASGDGDFKLLCKRIKQKSRKVIGIGNEGQTSTSLRETCNKFYYLEEIDKELSKLEKPLREFKNLVNRAFHELPRNEDGWVDCGPLGTKLREVTFDFESRFGGEKLSTWLKRLNGYFETQGQRVRKIGNK